MGVITEELKKVLREIDPIFTEGYKAERILQVINKHYVKRQAVRTLLDAVDELCMHKSGVIVSEFFLPCNIVRHADLMDIKTAADTVRKVMG